MTTCRMPLQSKSMNDAASLGRRDGAARFPVRFISTRLWIWFENPMSKFSRFSPRLSQAEIERGLQKGRDTDISLMKLDVACRS